MKVICQPTPRTNPKHLRRDTKRHCGDRLLLGQPPLHKRVLVDTEEEVGDKVMTDELVASFSLDLPVLTPPFPFPIDVDSTTQLYDLSSGPASTCRNTVVTGLTRPGQ